MTGLAQERYLLVTTFRRDGAPVPTPVWAVPVEDAAFGFYTSSATGKAKRLAHTDRVVLQPCDMRGRTRKGTRPVDGVARLVGGDELARIRVRANEKYGAATTIVRWVDQIKYRLRGKPYTYGDLGVVVSLDPAGPGARRRTA
ncbi:MAG: PPOX class F420-dependent oxidoreductase [Acidimicrobiales bacterium]